MNTKNANQKITKTRLLDICNKLENFQTGQSFLNQKIDSATDVIDKALDNFDIENDELALSFNGGKDCTLLFFLLMKTIASRSDSISSTGRFPTIKTLYIKPKNSFVEMDNFIQVFSDFLDIYSCDKEMKLAIEEYMVKNRNIKGILMGTRKTDPFSENLKHFERCTNPYPQNLYRIFPILDFRYHDVWRIIIGCNIPYCVLYDTGYTSIGNCETSVKNPHLKYYSEKDVECYLEAFKLEEEDKERCSRTKCNHI